MTKHQLEAIALLRGSRYPGVLTASASAMVDGQPWINWRTAQALDRAGKVRIVGHGEDAEILVCRPECPTCDGDGEVCVGFGIYSHMRPGLARCPDCGGTGEAP